ncbi:MAG: hypothetical protein ABIH46_08505 [Chloroflexota bacterium]
MGEIGRLAAFILLIIGTLGLLANEFVFAWGTPAAAAFAAINVLGLTVLFLVAWRTKPRT